MSTTLENKETKEEFTLVLKPKFAEIMNSKSLSDKDKMAKILEDTISYYNSRNRCHVPLVGCKYSPDSLGIKSISEGCAIGRMLEDESQKFLDRKLGGNTWYQIMNTTNFKLNVPEFMKEHRDFLRSLQGLHDNGSNWDTTGLSKNGYKVVENIRKEYI